MKNKKNILYFLLTVALIALAGLIAFAGWMMAGTRMKVQPVAEVPDQKEQQHVEIYFYRTDGIYRLTDEATSPEKIVGLNFDREKNYVFNSEFKLMGKEQNLLVYRDSFGVNEKTKEIQFALIVYDLINKKEVLRIQEPNSSVVSFAVSPAGSSLAYVANNFDASKNIQTDSAPYYQTLSYWNGTDSPKKIIEKTSDFSSIALGIWLDENYLTAGSGYEGASYCKIDVRTDRKIPENCSGYGVTVMGILDTIKSVIANKLYGYRYEWQEIVGNNRSSSQGIFEQDEKGERRYIISDAPSDLVASAGDNIYYFRHNKNATKYVWNGVETDLYMVSKNGESLRRLTNDGNTLLAKSNLSLSSDGRFLSYQVMDISQISPDKNTLEEQTSHSSIWLYDTKLNKYYSVAKEGLAPKVVLRTSVKSFTE